MWIKLKACMNILRGRGVVYGVKVYMRGKHVVLESGNPKGLTMIFKNLFDTIRNFKQIGQSFCILLQDRDEEGVLVPAKRKTVSIANHEFTACCDKCDPERIVGSMPDNETEERKMLLESVIYKCRNCNVQICHRHEEK